MKTEMMNRRIYANRKFDTVVENCMKPNKITTYGDDYEKYNDPSSGFISKLFKETINSTSSSSSEDDKIILNYHPNNAKIKQTKNLRYKHKRDLFSPLHKRAMISDTKTTTKIFPKPHQTIILNSSISDNEEFKSPLKHNILIKNEKPYTSPAKLRDNSKLVMMMQNYTFKSPNKRRVLSFSPSSRPPTKYSDKRISQYNKLISCNAPSTAAGTKMRIKKHSENPAKNQTICGSGGPRLLSPVNRQLQDMFLDSSFNKKSSNKKMNRNSNIHTLISDNEIADIRDQIR
jgi:hypothetical protein